MSRKSIGLKRGIKELNTDSSGKILGEPESGVNSSIFGTGSQARKFDTELFRQEGEETLKEKKTSRQSRNATNTSLSLVGGGCISNKKTSPRSMIKAQLSHKKPQPLTYQSQSYNFIQKFIPLQSDLA